MSLVDRNMVLSRYVCFPFFFYSFFSEYYHLENENIVFKELSDQNPSKVFPEPLGMVGLLSLVSVFIGSPLYSLSSGFTDRKVPTLQEDFSFHLPCEQKLIFSPSSCLTEGINLFPKL